MSPQGKPYRSAEQVPLTLSKLILWIAVMFPVHVVKFTRFWLLPSGKRDFAPRGFKKRANTKHSKRRGVTFWETERASVQQLLHAA